MNNIWRKIGVGIAAALLSLEAGLNTAQAVQFTGMNAPYEQEIYSGPTSWPGFAWNSSGNLITRSNGQMFEFSPVADTVYHGTNVHSFVAHTVTGLGNGIGITNGLDGYIYANSTSGLQQVDITTWTATTLPRSVSGSYGIGTLPDGRIVYGNGSNQLYRYDVGTATNTLIYDAGSFIDGVTVAPTGQIFLAILSLHRVDIIDSNGVLLNQFSVVHPADGLAFGTGGAYGANTDGTLTRFDFAGPAYTGAVTETVIASGGTYGDISNAGPDGMFYVSQLNSVHWDDNSTTPETAIIRISPNIFLPSPGAPPVPGVDLTVSALSSSATGTVNTGSSITISDTVANIGTLATTVPSNSVSYYLSSSATISTSDVYIGSRSIASLAAGANNSASITATIPRTLPAGHYCIGAIVDPFNSQPETLEGNNTAVAPTCFNVVVVAADLKPTALSASASSLAAGESLNVLDTVTNQGNLATSGIFYVYYYLSSDTRATLQDHFIGSRTIVTSLAAGASTSATTSITIPANFPPGIYHLAMIVDPSLSQPESNENNNTMTLSGTVTVNPAAVVDIDVARDIAGAMISASSSKDPILHPIANLINGVHNASWLSSNGGWVDGTNGTFPDTVQITFNGTKTIDQVVVYTLQDNSSNPVEPFDTMTFSLYGVTGFVVQGWDVKKGWITLGTVSGNNLVKRTVTFSPYTTNRIRIYIANAVDGLSRLTEIEAWGH